MSQHEPTSWAGCPECVIQERRADVRHPCYWEVSVFSPFPMTEPDKRWPTLMRDLSVGGVGLLMGRPVEVGRLLIVDVQNSLGTFAVSKITRVDHVRENPEGLRSKRWHVGCEFAEPLTEAELQALLS